MPLEFRTPIEVVLRIDRGPQQGGRSRKIGRAGAERGLDLLESPWQCFEGSHHQTDGVAVVDVREVRDGALPDSGDGRPSAPPTAGWGYALPP
jgi:hypothetical protein